MLILFNSWAATWVLRSCTIYVTVLKAIHPPDGSSFRLLRSGDLTARYGMAHEASCQYFDNCTDVDA